MEFKKLELEEGRGLLKRIVSSRQTRRSLIAMVAGSAIALIIFYFSEGRYLETIPAWDIVKSILIGGFLGFFITNSPCARGIC